MTQILPPHLIKNSINDQTLTTLIITIDFVFNSFMNSTSCQPQNKNTEKYSRNYFVVFFPLITVLSVFVFVDRRTTTTAATKEVWKNTWS